MPGPGFIHLHIHSAYSLLEGALKPRLAARSGQGRQAAGAGDRGHQQSVRGAGVFGEGGGEGHPAGARSGTDARFRAAIRAGLRPQPCARRFRQGRRRADRRQRDRLRQSEPAGEPRPISRARRDARRRSSTGSTRAIPRGSSASAAGPRARSTPIVRLGLDGLAENRLESLRHLFGDRFYVELQRHGRQSEIANEEKLIDYAYRRGVPLVATNEPFFATRGDFEAHDALLAIAAGSVVAQTERRKLTPEHYFKTRAEMAGVVQGPARGAREHRRNRAAGELPAADARADPAALCGVPGPDRGRGDGRRGRAAARRSACGAQAAVRDGRHGRGVLASKYEERLEFELGVIIKMKYPGYFLIVADFIQWAKAHDIPVGPGRGSGAGSLVAYALTIPDLDPLRYDLLFERFLNPDRVSMPDFDIDFCQDRRGEVIDYVQQKYGADQVAQIITFGTLQAQGRGARRRPRAADALWAGRPHLQADPGQPGQSRDAGAGARHGAAAQGDARRRRAGRRR